ncbi:PREDICTED: probable UDP-N-acetylglucosamine--peptide N-acetylglucosaminyltransferase SEC [Nicotiana attenuata]|uniref:probable UDP-N-acetylglucosamine--peptide N-acetylglucosaminyltransferase SEC n=1 Tax=Nicotiana attenuata TaxID=49451 RepID=UPI000904BBB2|nr:PREDICTED: probable UDP-N-acetylglucosamine--peptide N-acetylglucosaminyltransferase SEC [Nicotiana attenuata]
MEKEVSLALCPKLQDLTNRLKVVHMSCPLFDTARRVRNLERSYFKLCPNIADAWSNLASAYMRKGRLNEADQCCLQALARLVDAHSNLGNLMKAQGLVQEAYNCYVEALRIQPTFSIAWSNLAGLFMETGNLNRALQYYKV